MKLASYKDGTRDGQLVVVSRDLKTAHYATAAATRMQHLLDDWGFISPQLQDIYDALNQGRSRHAFAFEPDRCAAPLPRAFLWAHDAADESPGVAGGCGNLPGLVRSPSDYFAGPCDTVGLPSTAETALVAAGLAAMTGDVPHLASAAEAIDGVRLLALVGEMSIGGASGGTASSLVTAFGPVAVTTDELGAAWRGGRAQIDMWLQAGNAKGVHVRADSATRRHFGELIEALCRTRRLGAGAILGSMALSGGDDATPRLSRGARLRIGTLDPSGQPASLFGELVLALAAAPSGLLSADASQGDTADESDSPAPAGGQ